jgi:putative inorganic carbon (hco3(-)) transporter
MRHLNPPVKMVLTQSALAVLFAAAAAAVLIAVFLTDKTIALVLLGAVALAAALYLSGNPRLFFLWGLVLTAPFEFGKDFMPIPHMGGAAAYSITLSDLFLVPMVFFLLRDRVQGTRKRIHISGVAFYWIALMGLGMITVTTGPLRHVTAHEIFRMLKCLVLFVVIINEVARPKQFLHVFGALAVGIVIQSLVAMVQYAFRANLGLQFLGEATEKSLKYASEATYRGASDVFRVGALLGHPNLFAAFLALLLPVCLALLFSRIRPAYKAATVVTAMLGTVALVLTLSRAGWIAFGVAFTILLALSFMHPKLRTRYFMIRVALIGVIVVMGAAFSGPIIKRFTESDPGAVNFRYEWMEVSWDMIRDKPILGFGLNTFVFYMPKYTRYGGPLKITERFGEDWPVVHNIYLLTWVEQGTVGFLFFLGLHLHVLWLAFQNTKYVRDLTLYTMNIGLLSGFIALMVDGFGSFFIRNPSCGRIYWIAVALIVAIHYWHKNSPAAEPAPLQDAAPSIVFAEPGRAAP